LDDGHLETLLPCTVRKYQVLPQEQREGLISPSLNNSCYAAQESVVTIYFSLNGIEEEYRDKKTAEGKKCQDLLVSASGKLELLDKLHLWGKWSPYLDLLPV
jgi:hypothetical protein